VRRRPNEVPSKTATYSYDILGLLTGLVYTQGDTVLTSYSFEGIVTSAAVTSSPAPSPTSPNAILPAHDTTGYVDAIVSGGYTAGAVLTSVTSSDGTVAYTYDALGQLLSATYSSNPQSLIPLPSPIATMLTATGSPPTAASTPPGWTIVSSPTAPIPTPTMPKGTEPPGSSIPMEPGL
jgi:YD repeat-containing protein